MSHDSERPDRSSSAPLLACEALTVRYPPTPGRDDAGRAAVDGVTLHVQAGEIVGLVGRNGAGKSTLIRAAAGLLAPQEGTMRVCGLDPLVEPAAVMRDVDFCSPSQRYSPTSRQPRHSR